MVAGVVSIPDWLYFRFIIHASFSIFTFQLLCQRLFHWSSDLVLYFSCFKKSFPPQILLHWTKASSQCIPNYMFWLEPCILRVASPFVNVARLGPNQHPQSPVPDPPTAQNYHYPTILASRPTTVMPGMTRTRLCDLGVWLVLLQQRAVLDCVECVCPAKSATLKNVGQGDLGNLTCPFNCDRWSLKTTFPWQQTASLLYLKSLKAEKNKQKVEWLTLRIRFDFTGLYFRSFPE